MSRIFVGRFVVGVGVGSSNHIGVGGVAVKASNAVNASKAATVSKVSFGRQSSLSSRSPPLPVTPLAPSSTPITALGFSYPMASTVTVSNVSVIGRQRVGIQNIGRIRHFSTGKQSNFSPHRRMSQSQRRMQLNLQDRTQNIKKYSTSPKQAHFKNSNPIHSTRIKPQTKKVKKVKQTKQVRTIITSNPHPTSSPPHTYAPIPPYSPHSALQSTISTINSLLLKPRSLPLPRYISPQHYSFTFSECFGHASFILVGISYATDDFLHLRIMAVLGSSAMVIFTYFHPHGRVLWLPWKWNVLFILINSYRIGRVVWDRYRAGKMKESLRRFRDNHLNVVEEVEFYKLVGIAVEEEFEEGELVLQQGSMNPYIRIVTKGNLEVMRDGTLTYVIEEGNFVSEAGLHAGLMLRGAIESCATIIAGRDLDKNNDNRERNERKESQNRVTTNDKDDDHRDGQMMDDNQTTKLMQARQQQNNKETTKAKVHCLRWDRAQLMDLLESDKSLRNSLKAALSWDIVRKLKMQRHMLTENRVSDPTAWSKKREDQGTSRYAAILQNIIQNILKEKATPEEIKHMSDVLSKYRMIHHIEDKDHERALAKCGWTVEEFQNGERGEDDVEDEDFLEEQLEGERWRRVKRFSSKLVRKLI